MVLKKYWSALPLLALVFTGCLEQDKSTSPQPQAEDLTHYVDPFIGTGFHGHTYPGAVVPYGMVQLSPDTHLMGWEASSGYHYADSLIYGFSHTHLSGTGIGDLGDVLVLPFTGEPSEKPVAAFSKTQESAEPGYYKVAFDNYKVTSELTATTRVGMHKYTYDSGEKQQLLFDLGHILQANWGHSNVSNTLEVVNDSTLKGTKVSQGWAYDHPVHFYAKFSKPFNITQAMVDSVSVGKKIRYEGKNVHAYLDFGTSEGPVMLKVGISMVDVSGAQKNLETELNHWDFDRVRQEAGKQWNDALQEVYVETDDADIKTIFYTALYHTKLAPMIYQDVDRRYRGMDKQIHTSPEGQMNYTVYSLWDTFRAQHPLMTILDEDLAADWANNLMLKFEQGGILPKWPLASNYTGTMVGYPAVANLADALTKKLPGVDPQRALKAALVSASYDTTALDKIKEPRGERVMTKHNWYINKGEHIPTDKIGNSVTYGLENAYYDWCIAQIAQVNGDEVLVERFLERGLNYQKYFDASTGFMRGKNADGSWRTPFDPNYSDHEHSDYVEGNAWQWSWFVPHDTPGYVKLFGSQEAFTTKLDSLFTTSSEITGDGASADITGLIGQYAHGNEPSHHIAYFYTEAGQPWKTQEKVDYILREFYTTEPGGIIGNEDCGQMSAWYVMNAMGFYQMAPGRPEYLIGRPLFDKVTLPLAGGKQLKIEVKNNSTQNKYVQKASLNGVELTNLSFSHEQLKAGGLLSIEMGQNPVQ